MINDALQTEWLRTPEAAQFLRMSASKLNKARCSGDLGIPFAKAGRTVLYSRAQLNEWLMAHICSNTSEY